MAQVNFRNATFITSCLTLADRPKENYPEVIFVGPSNVGKSTLINSLTGQKIAFSSKKAGKTQLLNYFLIDKSFYLVDAPGYGFTAYGSKLDKPFAEMMEPYFANNGFLKAVFVLSDVRRGVREEEKSMIAYLKEIGVPAILILTKGDAARQSEIALAKKNADALGVPYLISKKNENPEALRRAVVNAIRGKE